MKRILFAIILLLLSYLLCCNNNKTDTEPWEGITDNILKIYISEFFPVDDNLNNDILKNQIKERLNQRASLLIASYLTINLHRNKISKDNDAVLNNLINEILISGKVITFACSENFYCTAHGVYDIENVQKMLQKINDQ